MEDAAQTLKELEHKFWQSMVDNDTDAALALLEDPALMVSTHGSMMFDHAGYRRMAEHGSMVLTSYDISDMDIVFPSESTAILSYNVTGNPVPQLVFGQVLQEVTQLEKRLFYTSAEIEARQLFHERADTYAQKIMQLPQSLVQEREQLSMQINQLKASDAVALRPSGGFDRLLEFAPE